MLRTDELREGAMYINRSGIMYKILSVKTFPRDLIEIGYRDPKGNVMVTTYDRDTNWFFTVPDFVIESDEFVLVEN